MPFFTQTYSRPYSSLWMLLFVNLIPALGVLFMGWQVFDVILIYVLETIMIGLLNILKMAFATSIQGEKPDSKDSKVNVHALKLFIIPFFCFHYFFFITVQTIFVFILLENPYEDISLSRIPFLLWNFIRTNDEIWFSLGGLFSSHLFSFFTNYLGKHEYAKTGLPILMIQPYIRIFIQQIVVIAGALLMGLFNTPDVFVILLVILKTMADAKMHLREHRKAEL